MSEFRPLRAIDHGTDQEGRHWATIKWPDGRDSELEYWQDEAGEWHSRLDGNGPIDGVCLRSTEDGSEA
jgi:hypothetical protein